MKYAVLFERTRTGYSAHVPDLPGCVAAAATLDETRSLMKEAIEGHLECMREFGYPIPKPTTLADEVEVSTRKAPVKVRCTAQSKRSSVRS